MMSFKFLNNIKDVERDLSNIERRQIPFATVTALNAVAEKLVQQNRTDMAKVFNKPSRWTLNAFHFRRATKAHTSVTIERKEAARGKHYLEIQEEGGVRPATGLERGFKMRLPYSGIVGYVTPTRHAPRNGSGDLPGGFIQKVLAQSGANWDRNSNETARSGARRKKAGGARYFVPKPGQLRPGVWERRGPNLRKVLNFNVKSPTYQPRLNFSIRMERLAKQLMPAEFDRALAHALATARPT